MKDYHELTECWREQARVRTCLWFAEKAEEAVAFYLDTVPNSTAGHTLYTPEGVPSAISFELGGTPYAAVNGGPLFRHSPAASISVFTENQAETDAIWSAFVDGGGAPGARGWCTDRYGISWQIIPIAVVAMITCGDQAMTARVQNAIGHMQKLDIETLTKVYEA